MTGVISFNAASWDHHAMKIGFFGSMGERIGREVDIDASNVGTLAELRNLLAAAFPEAAVQLLSPTLKACVDDSIVDDKLALSGQERIEFFPPLSGG